MDRDNYEGQRFGNRIVIRNYCIDSDWTNIGLKVPKSKDKYRLTKCLNCGAIIPSLMKNLKEQPPKRCVFCSNIGNHSNIETNTNSWCLYEDYAVCNVIYKNKVVSFYIDADSYEQAKEYVWRIAKKRQKYYVVTGSSKRGTMIYLHRMVLDYNDTELEVDHIDGNSLNNRKSNLRLTNRQDNIDNQRATRIDNQIGIRGIVFDKRRKTFQVDFYHHNKRFYSKPWLTIEEAVWCRYCFEDYFGLVAIKNNPIAQQYFNLNDDKKNDIHKYVLEKILGNKR